MFWMMIMVKKTIEVSFTLFHFNPIHWSHHMCNIKGRQMDLFFIMWSGLWFLSIGRLINIGAFSDFHKCCILRLFHLFSPILVGPLSEVAIFPGFKFFRFLGGLWPCFLCPKEFIPFLCFVCLMTALPWLSYMLHCSFYLTRSGTLAWLYSGISL